MPSGPRRRNSDQAHRRRLVDKIAIFQFRDQMDSLRKTGGGEGLCRKVPAKSELGGLATALRSRNQCPSEPRAKITVIVAARPAKYRTQRLPPDWQTRLLPG